MNTPTASRLFTRFALLSLLATMMLTVVRGADYVVRTVNDEFAYTINGTGNNPTLTLERGKTYTFDIQTCVCHPFKIVGVPGANVTNNNISSGTLVLSVPATATSFTYVCSIHLFSGNINAVAPAAAPTVTTNAASVVTGTSVTLNASVNPGGAATNASFIYGTDSALSSGTTTTADQALGSGSAAVNVTAPITGLTPATTYYFRATATNSSGTTLGGILSVTTLSPDSTLANLTVSKGSLSPAFDSSTTSYSVQVSNDVTSLTLTPTTNENHATIKVNTVAVASGSASAALNLAVGDNLVSVEVTAQDGTTTTYQVTVRRAAPSAIDPSFGTNGRAVAAFSALDNQGKAMITQADGKIVVAGIAINNSPVYSFAIVRFNSDGSLDSSFNGTGKVLADFGTSDAQATCLAAQRDGKLVVAGTFKDSGNTVHFALLRLNVDGSLDTSFGTGGKVTTAFNNSDTPHAMVIQPDGKIILAGTTVTSNSRTALARYNTDGSLDTSFGTNGQVTIAATTSGSANAMVLLPNGKILVAGSQDAGGLAVLRLTSDGALDTTFNTTGITKFPVNRLAPIARALAVQADGKIIVGGSGSTVTLGRYLADGTIDNAFGASGLASPNLGIASVTLAGVTLQPDGRIVICGNNQDQSPSSLTIARYKNDGTLDASFNGGGVDSTDAADVGNAVAMQQDGRILAAGTDQLGASRGLSVVRFNSGFTMAPYAWGSDFSGELGDHASNTFRSTPLRVRLTGALSGKTVVSIAAGISHSVALCSDGSIACWGSNYSGELGNNTTTASLDPVAVDTSASSALHGKSVKAIAAGTYFSLALCSDGTVAGWGANGYGQLGTTSQSDCLIPTAMYRGVSSALQNKTVVAMAAGNYHTLLLCSDGSIAGCGQNIGAQLGTGSHSFTPVLYPVTTTAAGPSALAGKTVVSIASGLYHGLALCSDGSIVSWGRNSEGQLGDGTTNEGAIPVLVTATAGALLNKQVIAIAAGGLHSTALCSDGTIASWGNNEHGQMGNGIHSSNPIVTPVAANTAGLLANQPITGLYAGTNQTFALGANGSFSAWGANSIGELGTTNTFDAYEPIDPYIASIRGEGASITSLAGGADPSHTFAMAFVPPAAEIAVYGPGNIDFTSGDIFTFNDTSVGSNSGAQVFTIQNVGELPLAGLGVTKNTGANAGDFTLNAASVPTTLAPGASATFTVTFAPSSVGIRNSSIQITSNDASESTILINLTGRDPSSNADLTSLTASTGTFTPAFKKSVTSYLLSALSSTSITFTPTVAANGATVKINGTSVASGSASSALVLDGGSADITIVVTAPDGSTTKTYTVTADVDAPEIAVEQPAGTNLISGTSSIDFGAVTPGGTASKTVTILNIGKQPLLSISPTLSGTNASEFEITTTPSGSMSAGSNATFTVSFKPATVGAKSAVLHILSNDANEASFDLDLKGATHALYFETAAKSVREDPVVVTVPVHISSAFGTAFSLPFTFGGTAVDGTDYTHSATTLNFTATQTVANITVTLKDNLTAQADRTVIITLGTPSVPTIAKASPSVFTLTIVDDDTPPSFSPPLAHQIVAVGDPVTFSSVVSGSAPLTLQWKKNTTVLPGEFTNTLNLTTAATLGDGGAYTLTAVNTRATFASTAQLGVVDTTPTTVRFNSGATATMTAVATGNSLTYQWLDHAGTPIADGGRISGAKTKTLSIRTVTPADANTFTCAVKSPDVTKTKSTGVFTLQVPVTKPVAQTPVFPDGVINNPYTYQLPFDTTAGSAPTKFVCSNLPAGLICNPVTGLITGTPTVVGTKTVTATLSNSVPPASTAQGTMNITAFPTEAVGKWVGLVNRETAIGKGLGGRIDLSVTSTGHFTGSVQIGADLFSLTGFLATPPGVNAHPVYSVYLARTNQLPYLLYVDLDPATNTLSGTVHVKYDSNTAAINGWRNSWHSTAPANLVSSQLGVHSFKFDPPTTSDVVPNGFGYGTITVANTGETTVSGRTADGNVISSTGFLSPSGRVLVYQLLYSKLGSIAGTFGIASNTAHSVTAGIDWQKNGGLAREYKPFGPALLHTAGGLYVNGKPVLGLTVTSAPNFNAQLLFSGAGITINPNVLVRISNTNAAIVQTAGPAVNLGKITALTITSSATGGTFSGKFTLPDPAPAGRVIPFQGGLVTPDNIGYGYFLVPQLANPTATPPTTSSTSPILSGSVQLQAFGGVTR